MDLSWVFLKELSYTFMALLVSCLDIASNSVGRGNFEVGVSSHEEIDELRISDDRCRTVAFGYLLCNVGADICMS